MGSCSQASKHQILLENRLQKEAMHWLQGQGQDVLPGHCMDSRAHGKLGFDKLSAWSG